MVYFQVLQTLCFVAQQSINGFPTFIRSRTISEVQNGAAFSFLIPFQCGRDSAHDNQLLNVYSSNWDLSVHHSDNLSYIPISTRVVSHGYNCSCATSSTCTEPVFAHGQMIPGFVLGCTPMESLFRSTLECLYNQTCVDLINISPMQPLDAFSPSRYSLNTNVDELVKKMFIERWSFDVSYSQFFNACKPATCTYLISQQRSILQLVTIALGFYGGLRAILYFAAPYLIAILCRIASIFSKRLNRVTAFA